MKHFLIQRPQFEGEYVKDPISGKMKKKRLSDRMHRVKKTISISVSLFFVLLVLAFVTSIFLYRATLDKDGVGPKLCALLNAIQIKVMNFIYKYVATWLNNWENYETDSKYYDGLTIKLFMF